VSNEHQAGLIKSWAIWLSSVLATSMLISFISGNMPSIRFTNGKIAPAVIEAANASKLNHNVLGSADVLQTTPLSTISLGEMDANLALPSRTTTFRSMSVASSSSCLYHRPPVLSPSLSSSFRAFAFHPLSYSVPSTSVLAY